MGGLSGYTGIDGLQELEIMEADLTMRYLTISIQKKEGQRYKKIILLDKKPFRY